MKTPLVLLMPFFLSLLFLPLFNLEVPKNEVLVRAMAVGDKMVVNETWLFREGGVRILPREAQLLFVKCPGQASVEYGGELKVLCSSQLPFTETLSYSLPKNVSKIYEGEPIKVEYKFMQDFASFPKSQGTTILLSPDKNAPFAKWAKFEENWEENFYVVLSLEVFLAFLVYLFRLYKYRPHPKGMISSPPKERPPYELAKIFGAREGAVLNAEALWLASKGFLDLSKDEARILSKDAEGLEKDILELFDKFAKDGRIILDKDWLSVRKGQVGKLQKPKFESPLILDYTPKLALMLVQGGVAFLSLVSYFLAPSFAVNYGTALLALSFINLVWLGFTCLINFGFLTRKSKSELEAWLKYKRFLESPSELKRYKGDWLYPLVVSVLLDLDLAGKELASRGVRLRNIQDPRITLFDYVE